MRPGVSTLNETNTSLQASPDVSFGTQCWKSATARELGQLG